MTDQEIKFLLSEENNEVLDAHKEIVSIQKDKSSILRFGKDWLDSNLIGGINNKIIFLGSRPGNGKTFHCSETINSLLDKSLNPSPVKLLRCNLEMPTQTLLLQQICRTLEKTPREVLETPYSETERPVVTSVVNSFMDKRIKNVSKVLTGDDFRKLLINFIEPIDKEDEELNKNSLGLLLTGDEEKDEEIIKNFKPLKTKKVCLIDHLHIYKNKEEIDTILLICNEMKMRDKNLSFIIYFQLRRDVEDLWRETKEKKVNPKNMLPNSTFIYLTDILQQIADIVVGMVIPQVYDLEEYVAVYKDRHKHLEDHFAEDMSDSNWVRLRGRNRIYYNFMKIRLLNSFEDPRLFCDILDAKYEETAEKIFKESKTTNTKTISLPTFENFNSTAPLPTVKPFDAFGQSFEKDTPPF